MAETPGRSGPTLLTTANTPQTIVTAGGAATWLIVRSIIVCNEMATASIRVTVGLGTSNADVAGKRLVYQAVVDPGTNIDVIGDKGYVVMQGHATTPDLLYAVCNTANGASVFVSSVSGP